MVSVNQLSRVSLPANQAMMKLNLGKSDQRSIDRSIMLKPYQSVILVGRDGDPETGRPAWAVDGSFLTFRLLNQLVPEFNK